MYQTDYLNLNNYDLVIESTYATPDQIAEQILKGVEEKVMSQAKLNPKSLGSVQIAAEDVFEAVEKEFGFKYLEYPDKKAEVILDFFAK